MPAHDILQPSPRCPVPGDAQPGTQHAPGAPGLRRLQSTDLLRDGTEIEIQHGDALYRLRLTSLGKLILTK